MNDSNDDDDGGGGDDDKKAAATTTDCKWICLKKFKKTFQDYISVH